MIYQLPLPKNPELFERLICDLLNSSYQTPSFTLYGRKGQNQHGIDIVSSEHNVSCQCKLRLVSPKTQGERRAFVNELITDANRALAKNKNIAKIIFATTISNDTEIQDFLSTYAILNGVFTAFEFWSWDHISDMVFLHEKVLAKYFPYRPKNVELADIRVLNKSVYQYVGQNLYFFRNNKRVNQLPIFDFSFINQTEDTILLREIEVHSCLMPIAKAGNYPKPTGSLKVTKKLSTELVIGASFDEVGISKVGIESPLFAYPKSPFRIQIQAKKPIVSYMRIKFIFFFNGFEISSPELFFNTRLMESGRVVCSL